MHTEPEYVTAVELEQGLAEVLASPRDEGRLEAIVIRPASNERRMLSTAELTPKGGVDGDRWASEGDHKCASGGPDPKSQVSLMNVRFLRQIAGSEDSISLAGDNLIVDLNLSDENLPTGTRLGIGDHVIIEVNGKSHTGCAKLSRRYGDEACKFMNHSHRKALRLRGRFASILLGAREKAAG